MGRLLTISLAMIVLMLGLGQLVGETHPLSSGETADATKADAADTHVIDASPHEHAYVASDYAGDALNIERGADGQFHLTAQINGEDASFLVDTGADVVALTPEDASQLGIYVDPASFKPILRTASGTGYGQRVRLDSIVIGGRELTNVDAVVVDGLGMNLLGQSVLRRLGRVELQGDRLVIEPT